ncbi:hypothetical protein CkaCkLH20_03413 [Colletotrichum karsti]|uniref:Uncharacterized protein n=1 Tax=Colletotrichum karsti TaxID=1095194 RepID=A0A9P6LN60_9PEZI|nr:uncharacterized protein CkaCkLH20_03413 [Colletotrichum karsti]KAF9879180.1 hypothetical protein CkaCkLH20_03413 [Colletotrichum karsti]
MQDLPDHVWSLIFDHLEYPIRESNFSHEIKYTHHGSGIEALNRLCQTSSRFLPLAQRVLYRSLPFISPANQKRLLDTLHKHTHLRELVQYIFMGDGIMSRNEFVKLIIPYYSETLERASFVPDGLEAAIKGVPEGEEWQDSVTDIWFAYCAILLPNLRLIDYETRNFDEHFPAIIRNAAKRRTEASVAPREATLASQPQPGSVASLPPSQPLSKLREFRISNQDTEFAVRLGGIQELFLLPELQIFRGCAVELKTKLARQTPRPISTLRHAYLDNSLAEAAGVGDLLRTCPDLQTLSIYWGSATVGDSELNFDHFGKVLREHGQNLETLDLDCTECFSYEGGEWNGKIGDLTPLKRLKYLTLPLDIMLGSEDELSGMDNIGDSDDEGGENVETVPITKDSLEPLLPESLEKLRFYSGYDEADWVRDSIQGVLSSQRLNQLKRLQFDLGVTLDVGWDKTGWLSKRAAGHKLFYR